MTGPCQECGEDPGFNWAICPKCGFRPGTAPAGAPAAGAAAPPPQVSNPDRWDRTIAERPRAARARFDGTGDFYQEVSRDTPAPRGLRFDPQGTAPAAPDRTVLDRGPRPLRDDGDHTVIDRRRGADGPAGGADSDETLIVRNGRRGYTGPLAYLVQRNGIRAGRVYLLRPETAIGRDARDNQVVLDDDTVSRRHAKVRLEDGKFMFWDLASANFSFIVGTDGKRTRIYEPHALQDGDTVDLGEARLTFIEVDRAEDA